MEIPEIVMEKEEEDIHNEESVMEKEEGDIHNEESVMEKEEEYIHNEESVMEKEEEDIHNEESGIIKHKKWTELEVRQLIALYKENDNLWNIQSKDYGMKFKRNNSLQTLADYFKVEPIEIKRKLRSLRSQFNGEIKKIRQNAMKEESDEVYISTWSHFSSLLFLKHPDITDDIVQSFSLDDSELYSDEQENIHNEEMIEKRGQARKSEQKNDRKKWSDSEIRRLISIYRKNEILWNQQSKGYRNRKKKTIAVRSIANMLKVKPDDVSRKLHNLRTQFCAELRKIKEKGQERNYEHASTWPYFSNLLFIAHLDEDGNEIANKNSEEDHCYSDVVSLDETFDESEVVHLRAGTSPLSKTSSRPTPAKKLKKERSYDASPYVLLQQPKEQDDAFGEFVASELRQLQNQTNKRKLKKIIMEAIANIAEADAMGNVYEATV